MQELTASRAPHRAPIVVGDIKFHLTTHSIERFQRDFRPWMTLAQAERELRRLVEDEGVVTYERPEHLAPQGPSDRCVAWVVIDSVLTIPAVIANGSRHTLVAPTCVAAGGITHAERRRRRTRRRRRQRRRRP